MNRIVLAAAAMCLTACHAPQLGELTKDLQDYGLTCNVKSMEVSSSTREMDYKVIFTDEGNVDKITVYDEKGKVFGIEDRIYGKDGKLERVNSINQDGQWDNHVLYEWDGKFMVSQEYIGMNGNTIMKWEYDNDGTNTVATRFYDEDDLVLSTSRVFDGLSMTETTYDAEGQAQETAHVRFWAEGKLESLENDEDSIYISYSPKGLPMASTNAVLDSKCGFQWVEELDQQPERTYTYEFDAKGNWIRRTELADGIEACVITRKIKY